MLGHTCKYFRYSKCIRYCYFENYNPVPPIYSTTPLWGDLIVYLLENLLVSFLLPFIYWFLCDFYRNVLHSFNSMSLWLNYNSLYTYKIIPLNYIYENLLYEKITIFVFDVSITSVMAYKSLFVFLPTFIYKSIERWCRRICFFGILSNVHTSLALYRSFTLLDYSLPSKMK